MSFKPQHKFRCYCGTRGGCSGILQNYTTKRSITSSSNRSTPTTYGAKSSSNPKFIKIKKTARNTAVPDGNNKHGLGHSYTANNSCYSRRNSTNSLGSTSSSSGTTSKIHFAPESYSDERRRSSVESFTSTVNSDPDSSNWCKKSEEDVDEYTMRRRRYERSKMYFQIDPELGEAERTPGYTDLIANLNQMQSKLLREIPTNDVIVGLQRFRLENPDDCFNIYRQNDLKMERRLNECFSADSNSSVGFTSPTDWAKRECCCDCQCCTKKETKAENPASKPKKSMKNNAKKTYIEKKFQPLRPLDKSLALRFQSY